MNYLPTMTEDEIRYVCSAIPLQDSVGYFKHYPKDFAKVMPGFRATGLKDKNQVSNVLFKNRNQPFITSFIEKHIERWLDEITSAISEKTDAGESRETALLQTLPYCFFVDNIKLYFKLTGEVYSEEFISILGASIRFIKESGSENERIKSLLNEKTSTSLRKESELKNIQSELKKTGKKLSESVDEIKTLKRINTDLEKQKRVLAAHEQTYEQTIERFKKKEREREEHIKELKEDLSATRKEQLQLEQKIREELAKQQEVEKYYQEPVRTPQCPIDIDEFKEFLGYNFEDIGVAIDSDYYPLLKDYLAEILFQGRPLVISRSTGLSLMKCVSNTLVNTSIVPILEFSSDVTEKTIKSFLSQDKRILCLDNFIGNYNETTLITICDRHRDKIIFLTVVYDRTLCFVPDELMKYCHYLNINRIEAFSGNRELTEDPSIMDEVETVITPTAPHVRWALVLKEMLIEFEVQNALSSYKSIFVTSEHSLCCILAFDILPYCVDVLKIAPFNLSERLVKYAGEGSRCLYKDLFRRWFA